MLMKKQTITKSTDPRDKKQKQKDMIGHGKTPSVSSAVTITEGMKKFMNSRPRSKKQQTVRQVAPTIATRISFTTQAKIVYEELPNQISFYFWCDSANGELVSTPKGTYCTRIGEV